MTIRKLTGLSVFTLFAAASLCAEESAGTENTGTSDTGTTDSETAITTPTWIPEVKAEGFYDNIAQEYWRTDILTEEEIAANRPREDFVPDLGGATSKAIKLLIDVVVTGVKVEAKLINILIDITDGVHGKVTISGSKNESQTGEGIGFSSDGSGGSNDAGHYSGDTIVAGYHIKDLYPEASNSSEINVKNVSVSSRYDGLATVCGIYHEQGGNGAQQKFRFIKITESLNVSYFGENANVAGFWQRGVDGDGNDKGEPPYISGDVILNNLLIESHNTSGTSYGIYQDGTAHIDGDVKLNGSVAGGKAFGVKGGTYGGNLSAALDIRAYTEDAVGIYLDRKAGSLNGLTDADGNVVSTGEKAKLTVKAPGDVIGISLGGKSTLDENGNEISETKGGTVSGAFANYDITATSTSQDPEKMAVGVYMHNGASVGSMSDLTISAKSNVGMSAGFVYDNTGTETMSVGEVLSRLNISVETVGQSDSDDYGRAGGIVIGKDVDFTVDNSSISVKPGGARDSYGLAYGKDVSGETTESDGGVGVFNHARRDSSGLTITNSQFTAYAYGAPGITPSAYGLYLEGDNEAYHMPGNSFTAIAAGGNAYGFYATGRVSVSNLKSFSAVDSQYAYGVYLDGYATIDATGLTNIISESNTVDGSAYGIRFAETATSALFQCFTGNIAVKSFYGNAYGAYLEGAGKLDLSTATISVKRTESASDYVTTVTPENRSSSAGNSDFYGVYAKGYTGSLNLKGSTITLTGTGNAYGIYDENTNMTLTESTKVSVSGTGNVYGAYVASGEVTLAGTITATREGDGTGKLVGLWTGTDASVSLNGATITTAGDALASDGTMSLKSVGQSAAQISGNVSVAEKLHFTQGAFSLNAGTIFASAWKIGSADASGNVTTASVTLTANTEFSGNEMVFYVKKPETRAAQDAVISVADGAMLSALATTITVVLDYNSTYEKGDVITLVSGNSSFEKIEKIDVLQNGEALNSAFYKYGSVSGGWGITFVPEPSAFGLLAGTFALALAASRRRRREPDGNCK